MQALVIAGHGSHLNPHSSEPTFAHAERIRATGAFDEVREAFWKEEPSFREVLRTLESDVAYVVPLFVSEGYFTEEVLPRELRIDDAWPGDFDRLDGPAHRARPRDADLDVLYCPPVGTHDAMTEVIVARAESVTGKPDVGDGFGLAVVGHGTERNAHSARAIHYHADRIRERGRFDEVRALFMDEEPAIDEVTAHFACEDIVVVPLFVADGFHTQEDIPADMGIVRQPEDPRAGYNVPAGVDGHRIWYAGAVGTEPLVADVIVERAAEAGADVGNALEFLRQSVDDRVEPVGGGRWTCDHDGRLDAKLDAFCAAAVDGVDFDGLSVAETDDGYTFETPEESTAGLDASAVREHANRRTDYVTNWYFWEHVVGGEGTPRRAFLRWVESAEDQPVLQRYAALLDGTVRPWGQLVITARLDQVGDRTYELRHEADRSAALATLDTYTDSLDARDLVTYDDRGRYRPLKTAPTLAAGWAIVDLAADELVRAIEFVYPASIANWHREREGRLDVSHFRETAHRQTGMYDIVDELPVDALADAVEACCVDSQCLKRRAWDEDGETPLAVERGSGEFPCREPCSLFLTAARKFVTLEREQPRSYEFELTPTEKEGIESILDAVATGRTDDVRAGDLNDAVNRYRARYLRARRLTERGLSDTRTYPEDHGS